MDAPAIGIEQRGITGQTQAQRWAQVGKNGRGTKSLGAIMYARWRA